MEAEALRTSQAVTTLDNFERIAGVQALTVPEILGAILDHATPPTLAWAARVSRAWSTIALDKLWSDLDVEVFNLLRVLPLDFEESEVHRRRLWSLQRNPTKDEWNRFYSYASRVRSLIIPGLGHDQFDPRITEWEVEKDGIFPRLRRIKARLRETCAMPLCQLRFFITPSLQELFLDIHYLGQESRKLEVQSFLNDLTTTRELHLQKLKLNCLCTTPNTKLAMAVAYLVAANKDFIEVLELSGSYLNVSLIAENSVQNLRALSFSCGFLGGGGDRQPIQVLVEGCPHVAHLRIPFEQVSGSHSIDILDFPGLRSILAWQLLSFEARLAMGVRFSDSDMETMATAWPKLKKLNLDWDTIASLERMSFYLSRLANIVATFPELEHLEVLLVYSAQEGTLLPTFQPSPEQRPSRLRKLRFGNLRLPKSQDQRDSVARFLAGVLPPGLRIDREAPFQLVEQEKVAGTGRDIDPEWDALFRRIEEIHGGVRIWVGSIPKDIDGVWF
ncbi:hypothetical protein FS837_004151 [Tulasnella sp. UAMH 9824]|nr:hypothetical protein FS837_004151 [Tulasnella sp. UAMH 9824]